MKKRLISIMLAAVLALSPAMPALAQGTITVAESTADAAAGTMSTPTVTAKKTEFTYTGKKITPSLTVKDGKKSVSKKYYKADLKPGDDGKTVGDHTLVVEFKPPYSGKREVKYTIDPKKTTISSFTADTNSITVKIKTQKPEVTGYEILYSTGTNIEKADFEPEIKNASITIPGLKSNTKYYFWVRTYKKIGGDKFTSEWSSKKSYKTKAVKKNSNSNNSNKPGNSNNSNNNSNKPGTLNYDFDFDFLANKIKLNNKPLTSYSYDQIKAFTNGLDKEHYEITTDPSAPGEEDCKLIYKGETGLTVTKSKYGTRYFFIQFRNEPTSYPGMPTVTHEYSALNNGWKAVLEPLYPGLYDKIKDKEGSYEAKNGVDIGTMYNGNDRGVDVVTFHFPDGKNFALKWMPDSNIAVDIDIP